MQRQRGELVPIGEVFGGLNGPLKALRDASPQALHHFTQADQVNQLVSASEADPDLGFMARTMALCSLPVKGGTKGGHWGGVKVDLLRKRLRLGKAAVSGAGTQSGDACEGGP